MKVQTLAIIFIIIILPISIVLSTYMDNQIKTLNLQSSYDSKLRSATYDAVKAFQINTVNSSTSDITTSKMRDIEAAANAFLNSISAGFGMSGQSKDVIKEYIPAVVFTMYDGYYIYSSFTNTLSSEDTLGNDKQIHSDSTYQDDDTIYGLKPYVYYSCRYKVGNDSDFTITYSLDNYITIQGVINGTSYNKSGYLLDCNKISVAGDPLNGAGVLIYRGKSIGNETLKEYVGDKEYIYDKINGVKYYFDDSRNKWFSVLNGEKIYSETQYNITNYNAMNYYIKAKEFTEWVTGNNVLKNLTYGNAVDLNGNHFTIDDNNSGLIGGIKIFGNVENIEYPNSNFNQHRLAVIRYAIESNLSVAIANYNNYTGVTTNFQMPNLAEYEWDLILNNISVISFMQGLPIGGKIYNGYAVVTNDENGEVVSEDSIYITSNSGTYHRVGDNTLNSSNITNAYFNLDFETKILYDEVNDKNIYYYPQKHLGSYTSIIQQNNIIDYDNIYEFLADNSETNRTELAKKYYTALGRERYGMYRSNYDVYTK